MFSSSYVSEFWQSGSRAWVFFTFFKLYKWYQITHYKTLPKHYICLLIILVTCSSILYSYQITVTRCIDYLPVFLVLQFTFKTNPSVVIHSDDNDYFKLSLIVPNVSFSISGNNKTLHSMFYFTTLFLFFFDKQYNDNFFSCLTVMVCKHYFRFAKGSNSLIFIRLAVLQSLLYV